MRSIFIGKNPILWANMPGTEVTYQLHVRAPNEYVSYLSSLNCGFCIWIHIALYSQQPADCTHCSRLYIHISTEVLDVSAPPCLYKYGASS
jgi:hypothetical protein